MTVLSCIEYKRIYIANFTGRQTDRQKVLFNTENKKKHFDKVTN